MRRNPKKAFNLISGCLNETNFDEKYIPYVHIFLGMMYYRGQGTKQSYKEAIFHLEKAKNMNNSTAYFNLGYIYQTGIGAKKDVKKALEYYQKSIDLGNTNAMCNMFMNTNNIENLKSEEIKNFSLLEKAAELKNTDACYMLGKFYYEGLIVERNYQKSYSYLKTAVEENHEKALILMKRFNLSYKIEKIGGERYWNVYISRYFQGNLSLDQEKAWKPVTLMVIGNENVGKV